MVYVEHLMHSGRGEEALKLVRKVVEAWDRKLGERSSDAIEAYHLLPSLMNKNRRYE